MHAWGSGKADSVSGAVAGADLYARDGRGRTPHFAALPRHWPVARLLVDDDPRAVRTLRDSSGPWPPCVLNRPSLERLSPAMGIQPGLGPHLIKDLPTCNNLWWVSFGPDGPDDFWFGA